MREETFNILYFSKQTTFWIETKRDAGKMKENKEENR